MQQHWLQALAGLGMSDRAQQPQDQEYDENQAKNAAGPAITPAAIAEATAAQEYDKENDYQKCAHNIPPGYAPAVIRYTWNCSIAC